MTDVLQIEDIMAGTLLAAGSVLHKGAVRGQGTQNLKFHDNTRSTATDVAAEETIVEGLVTELARSGFRDVPVIAEENLGKQGVLTQKMMGDGRYVIFVDPQDGTASGRIGSTTATAGAGLFDREAYRFVAAAILDPFGGRLMRTMDREVLEIMLDRETFGHKEGEWRNCQPSGRDLADGGEILVDVAHGFTRREWFSGQPRRVLSNQQVSNLWHRLQTIGVSPDEPWQQGVAKVRSCSSNLHHQMLVAAGNNDALVGVTTAVGGVWDLLGQALVPHANYYIVRREGGVATLNPASGPLSADLMIYGDNPGVMEPVEEVLRYVVEHP